MFNLTFPGKRVKMDKQAEGENFETSALSMQETEGSLKGYDVQKTVPDERLNGNKAERDRSHDSGANGGHMENGRPPSPEIDLMCHEQEMMFMEVGSPTGVRGLLQSKTQKSSSGNEGSELYAEQEKLILTRFRDFLNRLIIWGSIKGKFFLKIYKSLIGLNCMNG